MNSRLFRISAIGAVITAICCFTPLLVVLLGAIGLGSWVGGIDKFLLPLLVGFVILAAVAVVTKRGARDGR